MKYIFGPVPSRRLGLSLGVDLVPAKTCNLDCLYCECGVTTEQTNTRRRYITAGEILAELDQVLAGQAQRLDFVTLSGAGEPCLNSDLGEVLRGIRARTDARLAVITNSTLLGDEDVLADLAPIDVLMPSLDTINPRTMRRLNRPFQGLNPAGIVAGLKKARARLKAEMWLEILFIDGLNDTDDEVTGLVRVVEEIDPHRVQINTLVRPPAVAGIRPLSRERLAEVAARFGKKATVIAEPPRYFRPGSDDETRKAVLDLIDRRPCTLDDLAVSLGRPRDDMAALLGDLTGSGRVREEDLDNRTYFRGMPATD